MKKIKLLFVCTENLQRSPTAEELFKNSEKYEAKSVGTSFSAIKRINESAVKWADKIFVMEKNHKDYIESNFQKLMKKEIIILNIPDVYYRNDPELIKILKEKLKEYLYE